MPHEPATTYSEALTLVVDLATQNQIDERDLAFGDPGLGDERAWQDTALETVVAYVEGGGLAVLPDAPAEPAAIPAERLRADRSMSPSELPNAMRIVLSMAQEGMLQDGSEDMANEVARQEAAVALVSDLIDRHPDALAPFGPRP